MPETWVFGYGSLIWRPGFEFLEALPARLAGRQRSLCVYSVVYRGTSEWPGLVFGLDRGGVCNGIAYRIRPGDVEEIVSYLRAREQVTGVYLERWLAISLAGRVQSAVRALCYVADPNHAQYAGGLSLARQAEIVRRGWGLAGANVEYVLNTARRLRELGVRDRNLDRLMGMLGKRPSHGLATARPDATPNPWAARLEAAGRQRHCGHRLPAERLLRVNHQSALGKTARKR